MQLELLLLSGRFAVCRLPADAPAPAWADSGAVTSLTRTPHELSVVCAEEVVPDEVKRESGFRCLVVRGTLEFSLIGILAALADPLAAAGVSLFALSTYDTDYLLVREAELTRALQALQSAGHHVAG